MRVREGEAGAGWSAREQGEIKRSTDSREGEGEHWGRNGRRGGSEWGDRRGRGNAIGRGGGSEALGLLEEEEESEDGVAEGEGVGEGGTSSADLPPPLAVVSISAK